MGHIWPFRAASMGWTKCPVNGCSRLAGLQLYNVNVFTSFMIAWIYCRTRLPHQLSRQSRKGPTTKMRHPRTNGRVCQLPKLCFPRLGILQLSWSLATDVAPPRSVYCSPTGIYPLDEHCSYGTTEPHGVTWRVQLPVLTKTAATD